MKTPALQQQTAALAAFSAHAATGAPHFAFFMEQGTGKTWVTLSIAEQEFLAGTITQLVVIALNGVHRNWTEREIPQHLEVPHVCFTWRAGILNSARGRAQLAAWRLTPAAKLRVFAVNVEAFQQGTTTPIGRLMQSIMREQPTLVVADESDTIASPSSARTQSLHRLAPEAVLRLILTGTPIDESPFDAYAQMKFLSRTYLGYGTFSDFKAQYAEFRERRLRPAADGTARSFPELIRYRNLPELQANIARHSFTVRKDDCLDLPPKVYETRLVELSEEVQGIYDRARTQLILDLKAGRLTIANALVRLTRLSQITGGYLVTDDNDIPTPIGRSNAKMLSLGALIRDMRKDVKVIVWARFVHECREIARALFTPEQRVAHYWGEIRDDVRSEGIDAFQNSPQTRFFVGTPSAGGRGLTLTAASQVIYYSCGFSSRDRRQSEDRAHRIGQRKSVTYTDLLAAGTVDEKVHRVLRDKRELADLFMGNDTAALVRWLEEQ